MVINLVVRTHGCVACVATPRQRHCVDVRGLGATLSLMADQTSLVWEHPDISVSESGEEMQ